MASIGLDKHDIHAQPAADVDADAKANISMFSCPDFPRLKDCVVTKQNVLDRSALIFI